VTVRGDTLSRSPISIALGRRDVARLGEAAAVGALRDAGYRIVDTNVRVRRGELDIVAEERGVIVFVEVKSRRSALYGTPAEAVTARKRQVLVRLASAYLARRALSGRPCRFDVVEVWCGRDGRPARVAIIRDAFGA
jgi:putative endonuclease